MSVRMPRRTVLAARAFRPTTIATGAPRSVARRVTIVIYGISSPNYRTRTRGSGDCPVCRYSGAGDASGAPGTLQPGRDHWPRAFSNIWAGGGIQTGGIIGATDKRGEDVIERASGPGDFLATIYHHLDIDPKTTINDFNGRPTALVNEGKAIPELIG